MESTPAEREHIALEIHQFMELVSSHVGEGDSEEQIVDRILTQPNIKDIVAKFEGLMNRCEPGEVSELSARFPGFRVFSSLLESISETTKAGTVVSCA